MPLTTSAVGGSMALVISLADLELCVCVNWAQVRGVCQRVSQWIDHNRLWLWVYNLENVSVVSSKMVDEGQVYGCVQDISGASSRVCGDSFVLEAQVALLVPAVGGLVSVDVF
jgi:hypothetical protein